MNQKKKKRKYPWKNKNSYSTSKFIGNFHKKEVLNFSAPGIIIGIPKATKKFTSSELLFKIGMVGIYLKKEYSLNDIWNKTESYPPNLTKYKKEISCNTPDIWITPNTD